MKVLVFRSKVLPYIVAALMGLFLAISLWPWTTFFGPKSIAVFSPQQGTELGPLLRSSEKAETSGSLFWMLIIKGSLPAYNAPGERPYWVELLTYVSDRLRASEPHRILAQGVSGLAAVPFAPANSPITTTPDVVIEYPTPSDPATPPRLSRQPLIAIYHTHNSESFVPDTGQPHVYNNPEKTIVRVGLELARELQSLGAAVIHSSEDHVRQAFDQSYTQSLNTITNLLKTYPNIDYIFDIHRDAIPRNLTTTKINGQNVARVEIVIGKSEALGHKNWRQNYAYAQELHAKLDELYPGFSRGILLRENGRFNQHVHPQAVLIEIGAHENSLEEAVRATKYLAEAIMAVANKRMGPAQ